jgi:hypothetical protein
MELVNTLLELSEEESKVDWTIFIEKAQELARLVRELEITAARCPLCQGGYSHEVH